MLDQRLKIKEYLCEISILKIAALVRNLEINFEFASSGEQRDFSKVYYSVGI